MDLYLETGGRRGSRVGRNIGRGEEEGGVKVSSLLVDVLVIGDVPDDLLRSHQLLRVVVGDLKTELILHGHDDFHVVQGIKTKVVDKVRLKCHLFWVNFVVQPEDEKCSVMDELKAHGKFAPVIPL